MKQVLPRLFRPRSPCGRPSAASAGTADGVVAVLSAPVAALAID